MTDARRAVELRLAGVSYSQVATQCGYDTPVAAAEAVHDLLGADDVGESPALIRRQELERLDAMMLGLWPKARRGEAAAVDRVMALTAQRSRLLGLSVDGVGELRQSFDASVESSDQVRPVDAALIAAGRRIADRVDAAIASGEGQETTKALYLVPHMMNILREMLATPASRRAAGLIEEEARGKLADVRDLRDRQAPAKKRHVTKKRTAAG